MRLFHSLEELREPCSGGVCLTIGVFDAVHRGHQMLIKRARDQARMRAIKSLVFTFERHPLALLAPVHCPPTVTQPEEKARLIGELEVDLCLMLPFTAEFAAIPAQDFIREVLVGLCRARLVICGWNFSFGAGGKGTTGLLKQRAAELGFEADVLDPLTTGHAPISSTGIRNHLLEGEVAAAAHLLTRPYVFEARVVAGHGRGRTIGYPTANLAAPADQLIPADGVYAVRAIADGAAYGGMLNIGNRPTFEGAGRAMEAHLFDFSGELTGKTVRLDFLDRIRDEKKFDSVDALIAQLKQDEQTARRIWAEAKH